MPSNSAKGQRYKARTKKWLESRGYQVAHLERLMFIYRRDPETKETVQVPIKRDQFASDLLAVDATDVVFVQVKFGKDKIRAAVRAFQEFTFPPTAKRWVVAWELRARAPIIVDADADIMADGLPAHVAPPPERPAPRVQTGDRVPAAVAMPQARRRARTRLF